MRIKLRTIAALLAAATCSSIAFANGPTRITSGGLYSGMTFQGTATQPAITIVTNQPVTLENCTISFQADGILCGGNSAQLTVLNCRFMGQNPNVAGQFTQCAIDFGTGNYINASPALLVVNHCRIDNSGHIAISACGVPSGSKINICYNHIVNLQGSPSNGNGGWELSNWLDGYTHAIQVAAAPQVSCQVNWNWVQNTPFQSSCDDIINFYDASGTASDPIQCDNNFVDGLYPAEPGSQRDSGAAFTTDGSETNSSIECAYITFTNDFAVNIGTKAFQLPCGHDITMNDCYTYNTGYTTDSSHTPCYGINTGICGYMSPANSATYNDVFENCCSYLLRPPNTVQNTGGVAYLCPYYTPNNQGYTERNNTSWSVNATSASGLYSQWKTQLLAAGIYVGPNW